MPEKIIVRMKGDRAAEEVRRETPSGLIIKRRRPLKGVSIARVSKPRKKYHPETATEILRRWKNAQKHKTPLFQGGTS